MVSLFADLNRALAPLKFQVRGRAIFNNLPERQDHQIHSLLLIGNVGGAFWPVFEASGFSGKDALDRWTKNVLDPIAEKIGAVAFYPNDKPYQPFLTWAREAEGLQASPLDLLIHPDYGLWHAYRAAFAFGDVIALTACPENTHPCEVCQDKPCLSTCPVGAFSGSAYNAKACSSHVLSEQGTNCARSGCLARQACPIGLRYHYTRRQQRFHMGAFLENRPV